MLSLRSDGPVNPPRSEKSGAKVRFLVDPTGRWRGRGWLLRVEPSPFRGEGGKVRNRRNFAVRSSIAE